MQSHPEKILVVDDDRDMRAFVEAALVESGYHVESVDAAEKAVRLCDQQHYALVITDVRMLRMSGLELVKHLKRHGRDSGPEVIIMTAYATIEDAVEAMRIGAYTYIQKPFESLEQFEMEVERALERKRLLNENQKLRQEVETTRSFRTIIGSSKKMREVYELIDAVAQTDTTVLILGETGTGKELVARAIHQSSRRCEHEFVAVNCGALQETLLENELFGHEKGAFTGADRRGIGRFELANRGSIFLDEVGDVSAAIQVKLLRVLQEGEFQRVGSPQTIKVDVRVIAATNITLKEAVDQGEFRSDLYYRLNVVSIPLPPLRDRDGDIPLLANHFLRNHGPEKNLSRETLKFLCHYEWPGNVRELENVIERACVLARNNEIIQPDHLPDSLLDGHTAQLPIGGRHSLEVIEKQHIQAVLDETKGIIKHAAEVLGIDRSTLYKKIEKYELRKIG